MAGKKSSTATKIILKEAAKPHHNLGERVAQVRGRHARERESESAHEHRQVSSACPVELRTLPPLLSIASIHCVEGRAKGELIITLQLDLKVDTESRARIAVLCSRPQRILLPSSGRFVGSRFLSSCLRPSAFAFTCIQRAFPSRTPASTPAVKLSCCCTRCTPSPAPFPLLPASPAAVTRSGDAGRRSPDMLPLLHGEECKGRQGGSGDSMSEKQASTPHQQPRQQASLPQALFKRQYAVDHPCRTSNPTILFSTNNSLDSTSPVASGIPERTAQRLRQERFGKSSQQQSSVNSSVHSNGDVRSFLNRSRKSSLLDLPAFRKFSIIPQVSPGTRAGDAR